MGGRSHEWPAGQGCDVQHPGVEGTPSKVVAPWRPGCGASEFSVEAAAHFTHAWHLEMHQEHMEANGGRMSFPSLLFLH